MFSKIIIWLVQQYKKYISPALPQSCRYYPTCSTYMIDAVKKHGPFLGVIQGTARIFRCNPFVRGGIDPVGEKFTIFRNLHPETEVDDEIIAEFIRNHQK